MLDCVVLAAGASSRMGAWKLLLPWRGLTVIETVVAQALGAADRVVVVSGYRSDDVEELFSGVDRVRVVPHPGWRKGQLTSLQRGLAEVRAGGFFVTLGDMPEVKAEVFSALADRRRSLGPGLGPRAFRPGTPDHPGHPVLFDGSAIPGIAALDPGLSLRHAFSPLALEYLGHPASQAPGDLDVPGDYPQEPPDLSRSRCSPRLRAEALQAAARLQALTP